MSMYELKVWEPLCDMCLKTGPVVFSRYRPALPADWSSERLHDCGMTGYSRTDIYCPECTQKRRERE